MPKIAADLSSLWSELPYLDRFAAAADAGFDGVAVPLPYEIAAKETQRALLGAGLPLVQISAPPPNYSGGERGFAAVAGAEERFRFDLKRALRYCEALRVPLLHIMAGRAAGPDARRVLHENLRYAQGVCPRGVTLTLQPQSEPDAFLNDIDLAAQVIAETGARNIALQFHLPHMHRLYDDITARLEAHAGLIRLIRLADPDTGGAPDPDDRLMRAFLETTSRVCPEAWIVADYETRGQTEATVGWIEPLRAIGG